MPQKRSPAVDRDGKASGGSVTAASVTPPEYKDSREQLQGRSPITPRGVPVAVRTLQTSETEKPVMSTNTHQALNGRVRHAPYMTKCEVHLEEDQYERPSIALKIRRGEFDWPSWPPR